MWQSWNSTPKRHANQWNNADNDNKELKDRLYICDGQMATIFNVKCNWIIIIINLQCFTKHGRRRQQHGLQPNVKFTV